MFREKKPTETVATQAKPAHSPAAVAPSRKQSPPPGGRSGTGDPSLLSSDLFVKGNLKSASDIKIEGQVEGDVRARILTVGENATIRGQLIGDEIVVKGRIIGKIRGVKVRLNNGARVEGDIIHETIAIEAGAHFEGSVKRKENPLSEDAPANAAASQRVPQQAEPKRQNPPSR